MSGMIGDIAKVLSMPCREHAGIISRSFDAPLTTGTRWGLWVHERYCAGCRGYHLQLGTLHRAAERAFGGPAAAPTDRQGCPGEVRQRIVRRVVQGQA